MLNQLPMHHKVISLSFLSTTYKSKAEDIKMIGINMGKFMLFF